MRTGWVIFCISCIISCRSDKPVVNPDNSVPPLISPSKGVFIINEGNFQAGNASVSYYQFSEKTITGDIFKNENNRPLGDIGQSMQVFNGKAYIVVNNSGKIEIVNPSDFKSAGIIQGLSSPRYFLGINSSKAYVTDYNSNAVSVIDLNSNTKVKDIPCSGWTEELALVNNEAFVTNLRKEYIYVLNTSTDAIDDSIQVGSAPNSLRTDINGKLWVLCGGSSTENIPGSLHRINPGNRQVELSLQFSQPDNPWRLRINKTKDTLYFLNNGVWQFPVSNTSLPAASLIAQENFLFYGLGIDPASGDIYVSDAIDYVQKGKVYRYNAAGNLKDSFNAGIIPGDFYFY